MYILFYKLSWLNEFLFVASKISKKIDEWNEKLNAFAGSYMDNPWVGTIMLGALFLLAYWGIVSFAKK